MARKALNRDDMDRLAKAFQKVGADGDMARVVLDLAMSSASGFKKAFDDVLEEHRLVAQHEMDVPAAQAVLERDYHEDVAGVARELKRQIDDREIANVDDLRDALHQAVDGTQRVMYTHQAQIGLAFSKNDDEYFEEFGREWPEHGWSALMFVAMERDVTEQLERLGVDVNDPQPADDDEEET
jgi:hypothetical protein